MLDTFIRETSARWGLADQGRPLVQMLVAHISQASSGGLSGMLDKFHNAGWGSMVNSWVDPASTPQALSVSQVEDVFGGAQGFAQQAATRLGLPYEKVIAVIASVLPQLIRRMTPDGTVPTVLPAEFGVLAREGQNLLGGAAGVTAAAASAATASTVATGSGVHATWPAATATDVSGSSGGMGKWLPWIIGALVVIFGISYCSKDRVPLTTEPAPAAQTTPLPPPEAAPMAPSPVPAPATPSDAPEGAASAMPGTLGSTMVVPDGAGVVEEMDNDMPVLRVFFDTGSTNVASAFADKAQPMVTYLQEHPGVVAMISGFNDPTGDAARNAELSKQRAQAVKAALEAAGVPPDSAVLEKPAETSDTGASNAASRRVDVVLRR